ncbi:MAG: hypothetical protein OCC45_02625 [Desulfotalea sp.]
MTDMSKPRVAIIYYSLSQQTKRIVDSFRDGLVACDVEVDLCPIEPLKPLSLPLHSNLSLFKAMWRPFWRKRCKIKPPILKDNNYDHIILAGPTWSYQPSAPILSFLDEYGEKYLSGKTVSFLISCRSFWRTHYWALRSQCKRVGAYPEKASVFEHFTNEPWCTLGLILRLRGIHHSKLPLWFQKRYPSYGHSEDQVIAAHKDGVLLGEELHK